MNTIAVFVDKITPRKNFIINHLLKNLLKYECLLIDDEKVFILFNGPRINYTKRKIIEKEIHIVPNGLLDEENIRPIEIKVSVFKKVKVFFENKEGDLPFDIFSAAFFLITRYEEYYLNANKDILGRYDFKDSIAYKNNFLQEPIIEIWCKLLLDALKSKFPSLEVNKFSNEKCIFSFDIDNAYAFKHKGILKNIGGSIKALFRADLVCAFYRYVVMMNFKKDPFDTYSYIIDFINRYNLKSIFFFLIKNKGKYDRAITPKNIKIRELIEKIGASYTIGLHTSVSSSDNSQKIEKEKNTLEEILNRKIVINRYHYLKFFLPFSYRNLIKVGIKYDYSMGYHNTIGFRAGTSIPFKFFDLLENKETDLTIVPFSLMDITLMKYMNTDVESSFKIVKKLIDKIFENDGIFISIWHNEFLSEFNHYKGWRVLFERIIEYVSMNQLD